jgi:UDP-glucose 4-epimerase
VEGKGDRRLALVTGGAGDIGSALVGQLRQRGWRVRVLDNFSSGRREHLAPYRSDPDVEVREGDVLDERAVRSALDSVDFVWHLSANPDIRRGTRETDLDLIQGPVATQRLLEQMRQHGIRRIAFSSSSVVYGRPRVYPTPEDYGPLVPESLYGASKLACEGLLSAFAHSFGFTTWIFRFANVVGPHASHGIVHDFLRKLQKDPSRLEVLGDGRQSKGYLWVDDCVEGMILATERSSDVVNIFNLAPDDTISVSEIARIVLEETGLRARIEYTGGERGWPGDIPRQNLDNRRLRALGFSPRRSSPEVIRQAVRVLRLQMGL